MSDPKPTLAERIAAIRTGMPLGECHRQEARCNHDDCRLKNLGALAAEVGELEREVLGLRAVLGDPKECSPSPSEIIWVYRDELAVLTKRAEAARALLADGAGIMARLFADDKFKQWGILVDDGKAWLARVRAVGGKG